MDSFSLLTREGGTNEQFQSSDHRRGTDRKGDITGSAVVSENGWEFS